MHQKTLFDNLWWPNSWEKMVLWWTNRKARQNEDFDWFLLFLFLIFLTIYLFRNYLLIKLQIWRRDLTKNLPSDFFHEFIRCCFSSKWNHLKRFHSLCLCNEEWKIKSFYINDLIFHSALHKQRLWNLLKRFQFDEKV